MKLPDNIGNNLKRPSEKQGASQAFRDIKINMFREGYSERPRQIGYIFLSVLAIIAIAGLFPVSQLYMTSSDDTSKMRDELEKINIDIELANQPSPLLSDVDDINAQAQALENASPKKDKIVPMIELLSKELQDAPNITSFDMGTTEIGIEGSAENPDALIDYARTIEAHEQFTQANILTLGQVTESGKVDIVSDIEGAVLEVTENIIIEPDETITETPTTIENPSIISDSVESDTTEDGSMSEGSGSGTVTVGTGPEVNSISVTYVTPPEQEPVRVLLEANVISVDPIVKWEWDFGDGATIESTNLPRLFHDYEHEGEYTVSLNVTDAKGQVGTSVVAGMFEKPNADFTAKVVSCDDPLTIKFTDQSSTFGRLLSWQWDFNGDNTVDSTEQNPKYTFPSPGKYEVSLTVAGTLNEPDTVKKTVTASTSPMADFVPTPISGGTSLKVAFTDISSSIGGDQIVLWDWNFGDGSSSSEQHPTHNYAGHGPYTVSLRVIELDGNCNTMTKTVKGSDGASAVFTAESPSSLTVQFYDESNSGNKAEWLWDFGDGDTAAIQHPTHVYEEAGIYTVSLSVIEDISDRFDPNTIIKRVTSATAEIEISDSTSTPFSMRIIRAS